MVNLRILVAFFCGLAVFYVASTVASTAWQSFSQTSTWSSVGQAERIFYRVRAVLIAAVAFTLVVHSAGATVSSNMAALLGLVSGPVALLVVMLLGLILSSIGPAIPPASLVRSLAFLCHAAAGGLVGLVACSVLLRSRMA